MDYKIKKKRKQDLKYKTRRDMLLSLYDPYFFDIWFNGDEEKIKDFGNFLLQQENEFSESSYDGLLSDKSYYEEKLEKLISHKCHSLRDMMETLEKISNVKRKIAKGKRYKKMYKTKDLGIATYLNSDRYKKKMLNKSKYRKELSKLAKRERKEYNEMRKLGYIKTKDPDQELKKLMKANNMMEHALSDAYTQKHFIE